MDIFATQNTNSYTAQVARRAVFSPYARTSANLPGLISGGLLSASDLQLSAAASGLTVDYTVGEAIVGGSELTSLQGGYYASQDTAGSVTLATADPTNPRIDTICVTVGDSQYTEPVGATADAAVIQAVTGTPTAGATLTNLNGVASLPKSSLLLGYALVPAGTTSLTSGDISNVATVAALQPTNPYAYKSGLTFTPNTTTSWVNITGTSLSMVCTGGPVLCMGGPVGVQLTSPPNYDVTFGFAVDAGTPTQAGQALINTTGGQNTVQIVTPWVVLFPAAGSHTFTLEQESSNAGAGVGFPTYTGEVLAVQL